METYLLEWKEKIGVLKGYVGSWAHDYTIGSWSLAESMSSSRTIEW